MGMSNAAVSSLGLLFLIIMWVVPLVIIYFIIKVAIKNAIKELKSENII